MVRIILNKFTSRQSSAKASLLTLLLSLFAFAVKADAPAKRIITLSAAISETVWALGHGDAIVATDVTSLYPAQVKNLPKISKNRSVSIEVLLSYTPDLVIAPEKEVNAALRSQLSNAGIRLVTIDQSFTASGAVSFIKKIAQAIGDPAKGEQLAATTKQRVEDAIAKVKADKDRPKKVLFIYARGAGTITVAGNGSQMAEIISLAGGTNAIKEFNDFKPYSTETLIRTNPDVILLFDFGLSSLGGTNSLLQMPGVMATKAGKNNAIVEVDGPLMVNFSARLPEAITTLHQKLAAIK